MFKKLWSDIAAECGSTHTHKNDEFLLLNATCYKPYHILSVQTAYTWINLANVNKVLPEKSYYTPYWNNMKSKSC